MHIKKKTYFIKRLSCSARCYIDYSFDFEKHPQLLSKHVRFLFRKKSLRQKKEIEIIQTEPKKHPLTVAVCL